MINKENLEHWKKLAENLAKQIAEFETQNAAPVDDWPMSVWDLPKNDDDFFSLDDGRIRKREGYNYRFDTTDFTTEADAKSAHAFAQLSRLIRHINKGWEPPFKC